MSVRRSRGFPILLFSISDHYGAKKGIPGAALVNHKKREETGFLTSREKGYPNRTEK